MIGILAEKPSAARHFAEALGGKPSAMQGTYNGESYVIAASRGHLYEFAPPDAQVPEYHPWKFSTLPWDETRFNWKRIKKKDANDTLKNIKSTLSSCDEIVIATDDDPTGEGQLLAAEIIFELNLKPRKLSRMYFIDESVKEVQKAFTNRKTIPDLNKDPDYMKAVYRSRYDFLTMQFTRIATLSVGGRVTLRQGRLKSYMVYLVGKQLDAINSYKKVPFYTNKFIDENGIIYKNPNEPSYEHKEDVPNKYSPSSVTVDSKEIKSSAPPKLLDMSKLAAILAPKGFTSSEVLKTYQAMYDDQILSYPRTEDTFISPEQFNDLLPKVDQIARVVGADVSLLTHRTPRKTHVKAGGSHGANRPGPKVPNSLSELSSYGKSGPVIYEVLAKSYLSMLGEDYKYEAQTGHVTDYPDFVGHANVMVDPGYKQIFSDVDDDEDEEQTTNGLGTHADPFVHEEFPPKPTYPTMRWLMTQLKKYDVGTGATRTSIYADVTNAKTKFPLLSDKKGKISMTQYGDLSYKLLPNTHIGDPLITERMQKQMKEIANGTLDLNTCLKEIQTMVSEDIQTMQDNAKNNGIENVSAGDEPAKEKYSGIFQGSQISFNRVWGGHRFSDDECERLLRGEEIVISAKSKSGSDYNVTGKLSKQKYEDHEFYGFEKLSIDDPNRCSGMFNGQQISFKKTWGDHVFTDDECQRLLNGEEIEITATSKSGSIYTIKGRLEKQQYNGRDFYGFKKLEDHNPDRYSGMFNGQQISFKRSWGGHTFTDDECERLLKGEEIQLDGLQSKSGSTYSVKGKLEKQSYNGSTFYGFSKTGFVDDGKGGGADQKEKYSGTFKGKQISFNRVWSGHRFTDQECEDLLNGLEITLSNLTSKSGSTYSVKGKLAKQQYNGNTYYGFKKTSFV